jgi:hypothetical protein
MQLTLTLLSLASLGLNMLPAQAAAVPVADLAICGKSTSHVYCSDTAEKRQIHRYALEEDEGATDEPFVRGPPITEGVVRPPNLEGFVRPPNSEGVVRPPK